MPDIDRAIPLTLDRPRKVRLTIAALCEAEDDLSLMRGREISVYEVLVQSPIRLNDLCVVLLHGLHHEDPSLTLADVKRLMDHAPMVTVLQAVTDAWTRQTQTAEAQEDAPAVDPPQAGQIGDGSGPTGVSSLASGSVNFGQ